jgi:hypothetical protein
MYYEIFTEECSITLEPRNSYCDRGNWLAKIWVKDHIKCHIDEADFWPRYYFDFEIAKKECESFLKKRGFTIVKSWVESLT